MHRYRIVIEYDGTPYIGWQRQESGESVQGKMENAAASLLGEQVSIFGAGRTDSGVHALGQVAHFDTLKEIPSRSIRDGLNYYLKSEAICVLDAAEVSKEFHARFSAISRVYRYRILNRPSPPKLASKRVWHVPVPLSAEAMNLAAQLLVGSNDFTTFRATSCQSPTPCKTLDRLDVERYSQEVVVTATARSFLQHQVRSMVGTLKLVGEGKWAVERPGEALGARNRSFAGPTAPAFGLYLVEIVYKS